MDRLHKQLQYFVSSKISTDTLWQGCKVILSGHESPGEGEHKIMDYIRFERSKPDYDSNTRHCLYGLDAGESQTPLVYLVQWREKAALVELKFHQMELSI